MFKALINKSKFDLNGKEAEIPISGLLHDPDLHNIRVKSLSLDGHIPEFIAIGIYGVCWHTEKVRYSCGVIDPQAHEGQHTQFRR